MRSAHWSLLDSLRTDKLMLTNSIINKVCLLLDLLHLLDGTVSTSGASKSFCLATRMSDFIVTTLAEWVSGSNSFLNVARFGETPVERPRDFRFSRKAL